MQRQTRPWNGRARDRAMRRNAKNAAAWSTNRAARPSDWKRPNAHDDPTAERFEPSMTSYSLVVAHEARLRPQRSARMRVEVFYRRKGAQPHGEAIRRYAWAFQR